MSNITIHSIQNLHDHGIGVKRVLPVPGQNHIIDPQKTYSPTKPWSGSGTTGITVEMLLPDYPLQCTVLGPGNEVFVEWAGDSYTVEHNPDHPSQFTVILHRNDPSSGTDGIVVVGSLDIDDDAQA